MIIELYLAAVIIFLLGLIAFVIKKALNDQKIPIVFLPWGVALILVGVSDFLGGGTNWAFFSAFLLIVGTWMIYLALLPIRSPFG